MAKKTKSFVCELPLRTTPSDESSLEKRIEAARQIYNACLGEGLKRLRLMRESRDWQRARAMPKSKKRRQLFRKTIERFDFKKAALDRLAISCKNAAFRDHLGPHEAQSMASRAFGAVEQYAFGKRGRPRYKGYSRIHSIEAKTNAAGIRYRDGAVHWNGLVLQTMLDPRDKDGWQKEALSRRTKYCRIVRRNVQGKTIWYVQLIQEGLPPTKKRHLRKEGVVGLDLGPSTIAVVAEGTAKLDKFCPTVEQPWADVRRIQRAMDRSRRATNPDNYNENGTIKKGPKRWHRSNRYKNLATKRFESERKLAAERKRAHGELANQVLSEGATVKTEKISYRAFQKTFGRSVKVRAPGMLVSMLRRKAESAGGQVEEFSTRTTRLSQVCHGCGEHKKKPLSQRIHLCECGVGPVQRDLYSAFLAQFVSQGKLDARKAKHAFPAAEPLLRRAASSFNQSASRRASAASRASKGARADRPSKGDRDASRSRMSYRRVRHVREGREEIRSVSSRTPCL